MPGLRSIPQAAAWQASPQPARRHRAAGGDGATAGCAGPAACTNRRAMKKTLMTLFAFTMFPACAVDSAPAARDDLGTTEQALSGWACVQACADGSPRIGQ